MLCQNCHKNEATIHVQQIMNGKIQSVHLCAECAAEKAANTPELQDFNLAEMLINLAGKVADAAAESGTKSDETASEEERTVVCPVCGWELKQFRKTGYLGCPDCYSAFGPVIEQLLENMHHGSEHQGKIPLSSAPAGHPVREKTLLRRELESLRKDLEIRIKREEYEEAAVLRDRIQKLTKKLKETGD